MKIERLQLRTGDIWSCYHIAPFANLDKKSKNNISSFLIVELWLKIKLHFLLQITNHVK